MPQQRNRLNEVRDYRMKDQQICATMTVYVLVKINSSICRTYERKFGGESGAYSHLNGPVTAAADNLVRDKVHTVDLVRVARKVCFELVRLQVPNLPKHTPMSAQ